MQKVKNDRPLTKAQVIELLAEEVQLPKKQVAGLLEQLNELMVQQLKRKEVGVFTIPFLGVKTKLVQKPKTKAREGRNPATGETIMIKAKPARKVVKAQAMKALKDAVL